MTRSILLHLWAIQDFPASLLLTSWEATRRQTYFELRAKKARESLRNSDGSWLELVVPTPTGDNTKAYINADKSPKVERVEKLSKILFKICQSEIADIFFLDRATGTIKCGWTPIAIVAAPNSAEISFKWNNGGIAKAGITKDVFKNAFDLATGGSANVEWSS